MVNSNSCSPPGIRANKLVGGLVLFCPTCLFARKKAGMLLSIICRARQSAKPPGQNNLNFKAVLAFATGLLFAVACGHSQTLNVPPRAPDAPTGSQFSDIITGMGLTERENWIYYQVTNGNVPNFQRTLVPITVNSGGHTATYYAAPDYLAIGTDADYFLQPTTPLLAQRLCSSLGYTMPTRKMVNQIWTNATVKMNPQPITADPNMITVPYFEQENFMVRTQRNSFTNAFPLGALVSGDKKDVIISTKIYTNFASGSITKPVVIYGWHYKTGVPIQPLYNGHEETYADYSHGLRFIQNAMTVDGSPNTVTNVLAQPGLASLLSDEGTAEGTTTSGVILVPRYKITNSAPWILLPPRSQTVLPGASVTFQTLAMGQAPVTYRWTFNGATIAGATTTTLMLSNVQVAKAGSYAVVASNSVGTFTSRAALLRVNTNVHPVLFADNFDTNSSTLWNFYWGSANGVPDYTVDWAFDHHLNPGPVSGRTSLIPPAPNSPDGSTRAVKFTVNNNDAVGSTAGVSIYPKLQSFSGDYALKFDMWLHYPGTAGGVGSTGSTEFATCGLNHAGNKVNWAAPSAASSDGVWFAVDGEGGTAPDYRGYVGNPAATSTDLTPLGTSGLIATDNVSVFTNIFTAARFETPGVPGKNWVEVELRQTNNILTWLIEGAVIAQRTNTSTFTSGDVMLGYMDPFSSIANPAKYGYVLFDNVRVEDLSAPALQAPAITLHPASGTNFAGTNVTLSVGASGSIPLSYQWRFNGTNLAGATTSSLAIINVQYTNSGSYDVTVTNAAGMTASAAGLLTVLPPPLQFHSTIVQPDGQVELAFSGGIGQDYSIQVSTNLVDWITVSTVTITNNPQLLLDSSATNFPTRFYRAR